MRLYDVTTQQCFVGSNPHDQHTGAITSVSLWSINMMSMHTINSIEKVNQLNRHNYFYSVFFHLPSFLIYKIFSLLVVLHGFSLADQ